MKVLWFVFLIGLFVCYVCFSWLAIKYGFKVYYGKQLIKRLTDLKKIERTHETVRRYRTRMIISIEMMVAFAYCFIDCFVFHILKG